MALHLIGCLKGLVARVALGEVSQVNVLLLLAINVSLHVLHEADVVVQHLVAVPALQQNAPTLFSKAISENTNHLVELKSQLLKKFAFPRTSKARIWYPSLLTLTFIQI